MPNTAPKQTKVVHVAVGIVLNQRNEVLVALRPDNLHQGGLWEFPGGKVEDGEDVVVALKREFLEEINLHIHDAEPFMTVKHDYGDKQVLLDVWLSRNFSGVAQGQEGQQVQWANAKTLKELCFPEANLPILEKLSASLHRHSV